MGAGEYEGLFGARAASNYDERSAGMSYDAYDVVTQRFSSQHFSIVDGQARGLSGGVRYAWPAELDLMARLAGMRLQDRWAGWKREPFTALSPDHVSVYEKP